jgi:hypothetical protein
MKIPIKQYAPNFDELDYGADRCNLTPQKNREAPRITSSLNLRARS